MQAKLWQHGDTRTFQATRQVVKPAGSFMYQVGLIEKVMCSIDAGWEGFVAGGTRRGYGF
jgi:hypothetical protein